MIQSHLPTFKYKSLMSFFGSVTDWKSKSSEILSIALLISRISSGTNAGKGSVKDFL